MADIEVAKNLAAGERLADHLGELFAHADKRVTRIDERSYRNLLYSLAIFAAAAGLSFRLADQPKGQGLVALITLFLMILGDLAEGRYVEEMAQWRQRRRYFAANKLRVIEGKAPAPDQLGSEHPVTVPTHGKLTKGRQLVYHVLALGALAALIEAVRKAIDAACRAL